MRDPLPRAFLFFFLFFIRKTRGALVVGVKWIRKSGLLELDVPCHLLHTSTTPYRVYSVPRTLIPPLHSALRLRLCLTADGWRDGRRDLARNPPEINMCQSTEPWIWIPFPKFGDCSTVCDYWRCIKGYPVCGYSVLVVLRAGSLTG